MLTFGRVTPRYMREVLLILRRVTHRLIDFLDNCVKISAGLLPDAVVGPPGGEAVRQVSILTVGVSICP